MDGIISKFCFNILFRNFFFSHSENSPEDYHSNTFLFMKTIDMLVPNGNQNLTDNEFNYIRIIWEHFMIIYILWCIHGFYIHVFFYFVNDSTNMFIWVQIESSRCYEHWTEYWNLNLKREMIKYKLNEPKRKNISPSQCQSFEYQIEILLLRNGRSIIKLHF